MTKKAKPKKYSPDTLAFRNWLDTVPFGDYPDVRARIIEETMTNEVKFANWRSGTGFTALEKTIINRIAGKDIFS